MSAHSLPLPLIERTALHYHGSLPLIATPSHIGDAIATIKLYGQQLEEHLNCPNCAFTTASWLQERVIKKIKEDQLYLLQTWQSPGSLKAAPFEFLSQEAVTKRLSEGSIAHWSGYVCFSNKIPDNISYLPLDEMQLAELFEELIHHPLVLLKFFDRGCLFRAEIYGLLLLAMGCDPEAISIAKIYPPKGEPIFYQPPNGAPVKWRYHAAVALKTPGGTVIFDPALSSRGWLPLSDWVAAFYQEGLDYIEPAVPGKYTPQKPLLLLPPLGKRHEILGENIRSIDQSTRNSAFELRTVLRQKYEEVVAPYPAIADLSARFVKQRHWKLQRTLLCKSEMNTQLILKRLESFKHSEIKLLVITAKDVRKFSPQFAYWQQLSIVKVVELWWRYQEALAELSDSSAIYAEANAAIETLLEEIKKLSSQSPEQLQEYCKEIRRGELLLLEFGLENDDFLSYADAPLLNKLKKTSV